MNNLLAWIFVLLHFLFNLSLSATIAIIVKFLKQYKK